MIANGKAAPRSRKSASTARLATAPEAEGSFVVGLVEALIDDRQGAKQSAALISPEWLTSAAAAMCWHRIVECCELPAPKLADLVAAIRVNPERRPADLVDAAVALVHSCAEKMSTTPQSYRVGLPRFAVEIEHAFRQRGLIEAATAAATKAVAGTLDLMDVDLIDQHATRMRDVLERRGEPQARLVLVRASEIECSAINWLWPQRIVGDGLTIITGPVGISKSLISVDVAGRVTTGGKWPDGTGHAPQGSVILFGAEDDAGKVVVPRLTAAGADLSRVHVCEGASDGRRNAEPSAMVLERHIGQLRAALKEVTDCRLIVFDPLPDYIAADENNSAEVRAALVPLARLAQEHNVAVLAVLHQNKKNDLTTVQRIAGSSAFAQIARVVLSIGTHPEDADKQTGKRRVMLVSKNNYGQRDVGQAYEIETRSNDQPGLVWHPGVVTMDADEIARRPTGGRDHEDRRGEAVDALRDLLAAGEQQSATVFAALQDAGLGRRQIDHAANVLNVIKTKRRDGWHWRLPARVPSDDAPPSPDPAFAAYALDDVDQFNRT